MDLGYDGSRFSGWASQPGQRTVQGSIEGVLADMLRRSKVTASARVTCAGRTDAGVHARGQVTHLDLPLVTWRAWGAARLVGQLNVNLPDEIRVHRAARVPADFDARFSALSRIYKYRICDDPSKLDPISRSFVTLNHRRLDLSQMNLAGLALVGEHNFAAFCRRRPGASTVRTVLRLQWNRDEAERAVMTIESDAFCHSMVRAVVGALVAVGEGRKSVDWPEQVLRSGERHSAVTVMRPEGLVLEHVTYPSDESVGSQARLARTYRGADPIVGQL
jgi:tRNA pseudouridine38-40 synthase